MLHNNDVDMLLFTYVDDPNIIKSLNKESYSIYMDNYYWYLRIMRINNKIIIPMQYKYCHKIFYFKINTHDKYVEYICKHKDENIHLAYKYLCQRMLYRRDIINYLKYHLDKYEFKSRQERLYHNIKIFECFVLNYGVLKEYDALINTIKEKCYSFPEELDKNNTKELKLLNIIKQVKVVYNF